MATKYKDYPVYTYDEPATYSDFSGGINTDPSNEHLLPNEMRDCLNMHYSSAALVKRKGASLLCNIECEDELFNVQGVFLFTYRVTYIIIAADGKLYKGFYSPNATIRLSRLPISVEVADSLSAYNPLNITEGLEKQVTENINHQHDGFIYSYITDENPYIYTKDLNGDYVLVNKRYIKYEPSMGSVQRYSLKILSNTLTKIDISETLIGDYSELDDNFEFKNQDIIKYNNNYYKLNIIKEGTTVTRKLITPKHTEYWIDLDNYNSLYKNDIENKVDILHTKSYNEVIEKFGIVFDNKTKTWRPYGRYINEEWVNLAHPPIWEYKYREWEHSSVVTYEGKIYICIKPHVNYELPPDKILAGTGAEWIKLNEKQELIFQNHDPIEAATYNNKLYITTGTRFVQVELLSNELFATVIQPHFCNTSEISNIGYNYLSPYPELCRATQYNQVITSIGGILANKNIYGRYTLTPQMNFAQGETENDYYFKWEKKIGDEWGVVHSYKDNILSSVDINFIEDKEGEYILVDDDYIKIQNSFEGFTLYTKIEGTENYVPDPNGTYIQIYNESLKKNSYYELAYIQNINYNIDDSTTRYKKIEGNKRSTKLNLFEIEVNDADKYLYRVSFAKSFEQGIEYSENWDYNHGTYYAEDTVTIKVSDSISKTYKCLKTHNPKEIIWDDVEYERTEVSLDMLLNKYYDTYNKDAEGYYIPKTTPLFATHIRSKVGKKLYTKKDDGTYEFFAYDQSSLIRAEAYWEEIYVEEKIVRIDGTITTDWTVNKIDGEYFGQASTTLAQNLKPNDTFNIIHTCKKITSDGNKFLLYDDKYNSGNWYKTIIDNPTYITDRGGLSFKTNKNESLIKVIPFNGTLIAFANAEDVGGSIHMVTGNGDDWDDSSGYYSPYRRKTINATVSCNNANTVQVCENILVFKYFDMLYYISGSELNNEVVSVYSCNDKIKHNNNFVRIPWEDNSCISEVTEDYYALIWKEKYIIEDDELILDRPALKVKMYYKLGTQQNEKIVYPWLRDESDYFNIDHIVYIKGKPIYLYNNTLTTFHESNYTDFGKIYQCLVHFRGEDLNYPKMYKLISNILVYYHRNQYSKIDFDLTVKNEAGHILLDSSVKRVSLQDLRALKAGDKVIDGEIRLDSTILDSKVFNTAYKFPCLLSDAIITSNNDKEFSISSITYNYTTSDTPDTTSYDLYSNILRPKEVK
jgi:hypothetical protein